MCGKLQTAISGSLFEQDGEVMKNFNRGRYVIDLTMIVELRHTKEQYLRAVHREL